MADYKIIVTVPEDKLAIALKGFLAIYPNVEVTDDKTPVAKYTNFEWVRERTRRIILRDVRRGLAIIRAKEVAAIDDTTGVIT